MSNSQPLDPKKFGMLEDELKSYNNRTTIKTEVVDEYEEMTEAEKEAIVYGT